MRCVKCVLTDSVENVKIDEKGVCNFCNSFEKKKSADKISPFKDEKDLIECLEKLRDPSRKYDVLVPVSGGVDSSYALITIVEKFKLKALAYHNDHGYEDKTATENVKKLCKELNTDLVILQHDFAFMKKLWKYVNETSIKGVSCCYACGNIIFINSIELADRYNIPLVMNGYSKGQAAMTNDKSSSLDLLEKQIEIFQNTGDREFFNEFMGKYKILERKKSFVTREDLENQNESDRILVIPFYIFDFYKTNKSVLAEEVKKRFDWQPLKTSYPNRTTNCEMIWLNTYMDRSKMGYSMYEIEYSELVREGELSRELALSDLEFNPPAGLVERLAQEVDVDINKFKDKDSSLEKQTKNKKLEADFHF
ncbi:MAG: hypothetical protein BWY74_03024 [Firmicutes bacterium ADurb.Bin419]|nr:MAG: hypothetical protein BWY74_03024 [Firmicutes bacterium ADurb.Bin419]